MNGIRRVFSRHWNGQLHKGGWISLCVYLAVGMGAFALWKALLNSSPIAGRYPLQLGILTTSLLVSGPFVIWLGTGVWRANKPLNAHGKIGVIEAISVRIVVLAATLWSLLQIGYGLADAGAMVKSLWTAPRTYEVLLLGPPNETIVFKGDLAWGSTRDVLSILNANHSVHTLELNSRGGLLLEAQKLASLVEARGLQTKVRYECFSACTLVFASGGVRIAAPGARFGFHQPSGSYLTSEKIVSDFTSRYRHHLLKHGVDPPFVDQAVAVKSPYYWVPERRDLQLSRFVHRFEDERDKVIAPD